MKRICIIGIIWGLVLPMAWGQSASLDSLKRLLSQKQQDTSRVLLMVKLAEDYSNYSTDSSLKLAKQALDLAQKINYLKGKGWAQAIYSYSLRTLGELPQALNYCLNALSIARSTNDQDLEATVLNGLGIIYTTLGENRLAITYYKQALGLNQSLHNKPRAATNLGNIVTPYIQLNLLDSARYYSKLAFRLSRQQPPSGALTGMLRNAAWIEELSGNLPKALLLYREAIKEANQRGDILRKARTQYFLAKTFEDLHQTDSSLYYARSALANGRQAYKAMVPAISGLLARLYKSTGRLDSAYYYLELAKTSTDSLFGAEKIRQLQRMTIAEQQRQQEQEAQQKEYQAQVQFFALLSGLIVLLMLALILWRNNRQKHIANAILQKTLTDLRTTQNQLIQKEKMASLGELTAGIAHEIQNPLNFVNNFSEVSVELIEEQQQALAKGDLEEVSLLATDLRENLQRITHNGQRASNIVRGMLEHSRTSTGERLPNDLNVLCDEYLRLAYQGARAKDSTFNCELVTHFDPDLPLVSVVASDISRVLLNLFNNAFYAVGQKQKTAPSDYQPTVWVSTTQANGCVEIRVRDNGIGIPDAIKAKIFQPFFTTKPTGEGTGLGLSLSYDIVTKGHGGDILVESNPNQFTEFFISLPNT